MQQLKQFDSRIHLKDKYKITRGRKQNNELKKRKTIERQRTLTDLSATLPHYLAPGHTGHTYCMLHAHSQKHEC